jgi:hypothetical protein
VGSPSGLAGHATAKEELDDAQAASRIYRHVGGCPGDDELRARVSLHGRQEAGRLGLGRIDLVQVNGDGTVTPLSAVKNLAPNGNPEGGFFTVTWVDPGGVTIRVTDVFSHGLRPDGALMSGPDGTSECDGVGIDDVFDCLGIIE